MCAYPLMVDLPSSHRHATLMPSRIAAGITGCVAERLHTPPPTPTCIAPRIHNSLVVTGYMPLVLASCLAGIESV